MTDVPDPLAHFLDRLLVSADAPGRDAALLEFALASGAARAAALWRPDPRAPERWLATLERGPADGLPDAEEVAAVRRRQAAGEPPQGLPGELALGRAVLVSDETAGGAGLALAGVADEEALDRVEGLFRVWACVAAAHQTEVPEDGLTAPLPRADASAELRAFLDAIDVERAAFGRLGHTVAVEIAGDLLARPPSLGERRLYHVVRSLLGEVHRTLESNAEPDGASARGIVRVRCALVEAGAELGWELSGVLDGEVRAEGFVFRLWLPAPVPAQ